MVIRPYYGSTSIEAAIDKYRNDGFALLPKTFSEKELDALSNAVELHRFDNRLKRDSSETHVNIAFWSAQIDPLLDTLRCNDTFFNVASKILGVGDIKQHIQHIFYRDIGSRDSFSWHRDEIFRGEGLLKPRQSYVAMALYLDDITELEQGAIVYIPESHSWGPIEGLETFDSIRDRPGGAWDFGNRFSKCEMMLPSRGMIGLWNAGTIHGSQPNITSRNRRYMLHGYARADAVNDPSYVWTWRDGVPQYLQPTEPLSHSNNLDNS